MKIVSHPKKIQRYYKIGMYTSLASLVLLIGAVALTVIYYNNADMAKYSFMAMLGGLLLSQIGVFFSNRWGKSPRADERITAGLKGLDDRYTLYHYTSPVPHLLVGPAGVWVLVPQYQSGQISYEKNRYKQKGIGFFSRFVGQEGLGRPDAEAAAYNKDIERFLEKSLPEAQQVPVNTALVFTSPKASVQAPEAPVPTLHVDKLKDFIRRMAKEKPADMQRMIQVQDLLPDEDVS